MDMENEKITVSFFGHRDVTEEETARFEAKLDDILAQFFCSRKHRILYRTTFQLLFAGAVDLLGYALDKKALYPQNIDLIAADSIDIAFCPDPPQT